nr:ABC transporter substrate-binding protein [Nodosilinea sp. TSF1-S3]MDF0368746.1 ABC transporter substrate-binding protein [Nodosilinea sp. TSF1-S3]
METMPTDPLDLVDDLVKMGLYKDNQFRAADSVNAYELRKALFLKRVGRGDPRREKLILALCEQAGGLENAFAAAFGPQAGLFFADSVRASGTTRREFLRNMAVGAALVTLASCSSGGEPAAEEPDNAPVDTRNLEKTALRVGFIPITCATPIIMSEPLGFYKKYGFDVTLMKMSSWGAVRDSAIAGEFDAYHMLAPMPIAMTLGLDSPAFGMKLASIENTNGQAITVAQRHLGKVNGPSDFKGFAIGLPFPYSMHNLLMRYYLASGGLDPDVDVDLRLVPPAEILAQLTAGELDAMLLPDMFGQRAVYEGVGFIHRISKDLWDGHPCCAFAASDDWITSHPNAFRSLNKAIIEAAGYAHDPANRLEVAGAIAGPSFLNQPREVLEAVLTGNFDDGQGNSFSVPDRIGFDPYPWQSFAKWISAQLVRWDLLGEGNTSDTVGNSTINQVGEEVFLTDLARELALELGQQPPFANDRVETLAFDTFDPSAAMDYVKAQVDQFDK